MLVQRKVSARANAPVGPGLDQDVLTELKALRALVEHGIGSTREAHDATQLGASGLRRLKDETAAIKHAIERTKQELARLHFGTFSENGQMHAAREPDVVIGGIERAIGRILECAETIEETASVLAARATREQDRAMVEDIRDHVVCIFEACNFQDLVRQRTAKVLATLGFIEERIALMMEIWAAPTP